MTTEELLERRKLRRRRLKNRIAMIGVELEGGWNDPPPAEVAPRGVEHDGSVQIEPQYGPGAIPGKRGPHLGPQLKGEVVSKPLPSDDWEAWVRQCYPPFVNQTCGMHVHMSFTNKLNYQRLMTPEFTKIMVEKLREWAHEEKLRADHWIWGRLNDPNHNHCAHVYLGDNQVSVPKKDYHSRGTNYSRYTAINYCYGQHKTVECRLLPMFKDVDQAIRAIKVVLNTTNEFLARQRQREQRVERAVDRGTPETGQLHVLV